jgi:hypothetical protein
VKASLGINSLAAVNQLKQLIPLITDLDPEILRGSKLCMDDLLRLDKLSRKMKSNKVLVSKTENQDERLIQVRGHVVYCGIGKNTRVAYDCMQPIESLLNIFHTEFDVSKDLYDEFHRICMKYGIAQRNKIFLFNIFVKVNSRAFDGNDEMNTYLHQNDFASTFKRVASNVSPIVALFLKSWKEFSSLYEKNESVLIVEDERFNVWSKLITRLMIASEMDGYSDFLKSFEGSIICNRVNSLKRYIYRYVDNASTLGECEKLRKYVISRFAFLAKNVDSFVVNTNQPLVLELNGDAGVGKSHSIRELAKHFAQLLGMHERDVVYVRPNTAKYWTGYCGQPIVLYDDFNQDPKNEQLNELIHVASGVSYEVPCADIVDKGVFFSSDIVILTTNEKIADMNTAAIKNKDALLRRISYTVDCRLRPACGKLVRSKLQYVSGGNSLRMYAAGFEMDVKGFSSWCEILLRQRFSRKSVCEEFVPEQFEQEECDFEDLVFEQAMPSLVEARNEIEAQIVPETLVENDDGSLEMKCTLCKSFKAHPKVEGSLFVRRNGQICLMNLSTNEVNPCFIPGYTYVDSGDHYHICPSNSM